MLYTLYCSSLLSCFVDQYRVQACCPEAVSFCNMNVILRNVSTELQQMLDEFLHREQQIMCGKSKFVFYRYASLMCVRYAEMYLYCCTVHFVESL